MPHFSYTAVDSKGKTSRGRLEADDINVIYAFLKSEDKTPVSIKAVSANSIDLNAEIMTRKPKSRDFSIFCRQFTSISSAGVPVVSAFDMLAQQTENKMLARAIAECSTSIRQGNSLSEAMAEHPKIFSELFITMVAAGEASGNLDISFDRMATQFEKEAKLKGIVMRASAYPIVVLIIAIIVIIGMLAFVVPNFESILADLDVDMPAFSLIVINAGKYMQLNWVSVTLAIFAVCFLLFRFSKTEFGRAFFSIMILHTPMLGTLSTKTASARMCRTLSTLIAAGLPLIDAIGIVSETMTNIKFREAMATAQDEVSMGTPLSEALEATAVFPNLVNHMTKIGEESGDFESMLTKLADYYDDDVEQTTATVMAAMEPLLIVVLAVIIITIIAAVMWPMTSIYDGLNAL